MPFIPWRNRHKKPGMPHAGQGLPGGAPSPSLPGLSGPLPMSSGLPSAPSSLGSGPMMRGGQVGGAGSGVYRAQMQRNGGHFADGGDPLNALFEHNIGEDDRSDGETAWQSMPGRVRVSPVPQPSVPTFDQTVPGIAVETATHPVATAAGFMDPWHLTSKAYDAFDKTFGTNSADRLRSGQDESQTAAGVGRLGGEVIALDGLGRVVGPAIEAATAHPLVATAGLGGIGIAAPTAIADDTDPMSKIGKQVEKLNDPALNTSWAVYNKALQDSRSDKKGLTRDQGEVARKQDRETADKALAEVQKRISELVPPHTTFAQDFPVPNAMWPLVPFVASNVVGAGLKGAAQTLKNEPLRRWQSAVDKGEDALDPATWKRFLFDAQPNVERAAQKAATASQFMKNYNNSQQWAPTRLGQARQIAGTTIEEGLPTAVGSYLGAELNTIPDRYTINRGDDEQRADAEKRLGTDMVIGGGLGGMGAFGASHLVPMWNPTRYAPVAETKALNTSVKSAAKAKAAQQMQQQQQLQPQLPMPPNQPGANPPPAAVPPPAPVVSTYSSYPKLPQDAQDRIAYAYLKARELADQKGVKLMPGDFKNTVEQALPSVGVKVSVPQGRIKATEPPVSAFVARENRYPTLDEYRTFRDPKKMLSLPGTAIVGYGALSGDDSERSSGGTVRGSDEDNISRALRHTSGHWEKQRRDREGRWTGGYVGRKK